MDDPVVNDLVVHVLSSRTVFWKELGIEMKDFKRAAVLWDTHMLPWLKENATAAWNPHKDGVWFVSPEDALKFQMVFNGVLERY